MRPVCPGGGVAAAAQAARYRTRMTALTHRLLIPTASFFLAALALPGCGNNGNLAATSTPTTTSATSWSRPETPPDPHTLLRAGANAVAKVPASTLIFIENLTDDEGTWKTQVVTPDGTEQQMKVGVDGYTVLVGPSPKNGSDADKAKRRATVQAARLDYRAAVDKMLAAVPSGSITELSLTDVDGTTVWEGHVWDIELVGHDVTINAASGELEANKQV
jgi:hypothetical protein